MLMASLYGSAESQQDYSCPDCLRFGYIYYVLSYSKLPFLVYLPLSLIIGCLTPAGANSKGDVPFCVWVLNRDSVRARSPEDTVICLLLH